MNLSRHLYVAILLCSLLVHPVSAAGMDSPTAIPQSASVDSPAFETTSTTYAANLGTGRSEELEYWGGDTGSLRETTYGGKPALETAREEGANFIYFDVRERDSSPLPKDARVHISVEYWSGHGGAFRLEYDGYGDFAADTRAVNASETNEWKTAKFTLSTAKFDKRLNNGDFRINPLNGESDLAVRNVTVRIERPELELVQHRVGNVFLTNETPRIGIKGDSESVSWTVRRYNGSIAANGIVTQLAEGGTNIAFRELDTGHYRVMFRDGETDTLLRETSMAVLPPSEATYDRYGVSTHYGQLWKQDRYQLRTMQLLSRAGTGTFRDNLLWSQIEQSTGEYTFPHRYDAFMERSERHDLEPFIILAGTNPHYDNGATVHSADGRKAFGRYSHAVVARYDQIEHVEVYNEFNIARFGDQGDGPANASPKYYVLLVNETDAHLSETDVMLVGPATSRVPQTWLSAVFERGALDRLDVVSVHPYTANPPTRVDEKMASVRLLTKDHGAADTPLWISENGWSTSTTPAGATFAEQANYLVRAHVQAFSKGTERYYTYELIDEGPNRMDHQSNFGLVHTSGDLQGSYTPKPAYTALAVLTRTLQDAPYRSSDSFESSIESHRFANPDGNGSVRVMWRTSVVRNETVTIRSETLITVKTMMGSVSEVKPSNGTIELRITDEPIYVYGLREGAISAADRESLNPTETPTPATEPSETGAKDTSGNVSLIGTGSATEDGSTQSNSPGFTAISTMLVVLSLVVVLTRVAKH